MKVTFVLPGLSVVPTGGYRIHYEYARRLSLTGHDVTVVHPLGGLRRTPRWFLRRMRSGSTESAVAPWFEFGDTVRTRVVRRLTPPLLEGTDVAVLTGWQTAESLSPIRARAAVQIVFDYEYWASAGIDQQERISAALRAPNIARVATSGAVETMLRSIGSSIALTIPTPVDGHAFFAERPVAGRARRVGFIARTEPFKRTADAIAAVELLRDRHSNVECVAASRPGLRLPAHVIQVQPRNDLEMRSFYNSLSVFVLPSELEGFGLPASEALLCGAAVVAADSVGVRDVVVNRETGLLVPARSPKDLADAVATLLADDGLREGMVSRAQLRLRSHDWDRATRQLDDLLWRVIEDPERVLP